MSAPTDVDMKDASLEAPKDAPGAPETPSLAQEIKLAFGSLHKAADNFDNRYVSKVFRDLGALRRKIAQDPQALAAVVEQTYPGTHKSKAVLQAPLPAPAGGTVAVDDPLKAPVVPEVDAYLHLLVQIYLLDTAQMAALAAFNGHVAAWLAAHDRRTLDFLQAKMWFYVARAAEVTGRLLDVRPALTGALRSATLRRDDETTAAVITLLLRNYLLSHDVSQAANLCEKSVFPAAAGNALAARYYYYVARIHAVQLDYSAAHECVTAAMRKAPQTALARGFVQQATKLNVLVELLMGDVPALSVFKAAPGRLEPYFLVTKAVRRGDLAGFAEVLRAHEPVFVADNNLTLVARLRQNVIKTGIRMLSLSYSRISLRDVCIRLRLDSEEATEYIVSKAVRDGVIEASVDHLLGHMKLRELLDVYSTRQPQEDFDQRIRFCLSLHTDSVKAMRYPADDSKNEMNRGPLEGLEDEMGLLQAIEDGDLDDFMD
ncbi:hypothetical protein METBIDRAFT_153984 [Metschnikowia bicuspidata var. bicuspidata NRRL YB-4993]|uniref:PCI domain-containing protein n=1 Tax=Metschnikowia bicuspidata var. bicuspidata NRRL YB-4993 TaxID=869754 RepID=A0A1A0HEE5_9ASCO|nr:hypothetical protein METBIDRAFT_153984 [Metschnikowia bicuspidata var. bicuspidata NRRL YB-4993]OBA22484.1 hypothetical protein METBIDRAFT_153984 [Metschnikowia bicuspidata var. bicuspidata NRRL YB-4993]